MKIITGPKWVLLLATSTFTAVHQDAGGDGWSLLLSRRALKEPWWASGEVVNTLTLEINTSPSHRFDITDCYGSVYPWSLG